MANLERLHALTQSAVDAIISADSSGIITDWNPAAERIFGYSAREAVGQSLSMLMPARFREAHASGISRVASGCPTRMIGTTVEVAALRRNGEEFPIELSLSKWRDGEAVCFTGIIRDISRRKHIERELSRMFTLVAEVLEGHVLAGRYRLERMLDADDIAVVYEGTDLEQFGPVAVTVLRPVAGCGTWFGESVIEECRPVSVVEHANAIEVLEQGRSEITLPFVVTEFLTGELLAERLARAQPRLEEALSWSAEIAEVLALAHSESIVHGGLVASKVFLHELRGGQTVAKVMDFGLAEFCGRMQARDRSELRAVDDVLALGLLICELLTGTRPELGSGEAHGSIPGLAQVDGRLPASLDAILLAAISRDERTRPAATELAEALRAAERDVAAGRDRVARIRGESASV